MKNLTFFYLLCFGFFWSCRQTDDKSAVPFENLPEEEQHLLKNVLSSFTVAGGLEVTLFAAEPMLVNPTNMDIDSRGRVWVNEATNYRLPFNQTVQARPEGDRILILEDTDGNGQADVQKVFYQGNDINAALGIAVFDNRVIVSASPIVLILHDDNRDDIADRKDTLFSMVKGVDDDHGIHAFIFGPDGKLYFNFGNAGYQLRDKTGNPLKDKFGRIIEANGKPFRQGMLFRCNEDGSDLEVLGHNFRNIYEPCVDPYGNVFQSDNDDDGNKGVRINYIVDYGNYGYQDEITGAGWREKRVNMEPEIPLRHWHQADPGVIPNMLLTGSGSPAGITFYEGDLLPEPFRNQIIHAEPGHQVVRAYITKKIGAGYNASIVNILESKDKWFRPSDVCIAPDGSLFIADWHDAVVGGNGMDDTKRGRIYRITPTGGGDKYPAAKFDLETASGILAGLNNPNQATRYLAYKKLKIMDEDQSLPILNQVQKSDPNLYIRSQWLLAQIPDSGWDVVQNLLADSDENLRIAGLRMMRQWHKDRITTTVSSMANDPSPQVKRELALALVGLCEPNSIEAWLKLLDGFDPSDRWYLEALGMATDHCPDMFFAAWKGRFGDQWNNPVGRAIIWRIRSQDVIPYLDRIIRDTETPRSDLAKYFRAFHFIPSTKKDRVLSDIFLSSPEDTAILKYALLSISLPYQKSTALLSSQIQKRLSSIKGSDEWFTTIRNLNLESERDELWQILMESDHQDKKRMAASTLLEVAGIEFLKDQLGKQNSKKYEELVTIFGNQANGIMAGFLGAELLREDLDLDIKQRMVDALGNSGSGQEKLFEMANEGSLPSELLLATSVKLLNSWNSKIRNAAPALLSKVPGMDLSKTPDLFAISRKTGDEIKGRGLFKTYCSSCHQVDGEGIQFGPDLSEIGDKLSARGLYQAILYPGASISYGYEGVTLTNNQNMTYQGYIESETAESLQLRIASGQSIILNKSDLQNREKMTKSLMTEGLFLAMSEQDLVDLVVYLQTLKKPVS